MNTELKEQLKKLISCYGRLDVIDTDTALDTAETAKELTSSIEDLIAEYEVIYHNAAMKILSENDASLRVSLGYAAECGYSVENLNSEILATLYVQEKAREALGNISDAIEELFDTYGGD